MKSLEEYRKLIEDRPVKWTREDVGYRPADSENESCRMCVHFFERRLDKFAVCEIFRDDEIDREGINPKFTCSFQTKDGENFPLLKES